MEVLEADLAISSDAKPIMAWEVISLGSLRSLRSCVRQLQMVSENYNARVSQAIDKAQIQ